MDETNVHVGWIKIGLLTGLLMAVAGCAGTWSEGYYGNAVVVQEPDQYLFGGVYYNRHDAHDYSHRGAHSRGAAHSNESHGRKR